MSLFRIRVDLVFISENYNRSSDEIDVVGFIVVCILDFIPDYTVWVLIGLVDIDY